MTREICDNCGESVPATDAICEHCGEFIDQDAKERDVRWANKDLSHGQIFMMFAGGWVMVIISLIMVWSAIKRNSLYLLTAAFVLLLAGALLDIYSRRSWLRKKDYPGYMSIFFGPLEIFFLPDRDN